MFTTAYSGEGPIRGTRDVVSSGSFAERRAVYRGRGVVCERESALMRYPPPEERGVALWYGSGSCVPAQQRALCPPGCVLAATARAGVGTALFISYYRYGTIMVELYFKVFKYPRVPW